MANAPITFKADEILNQRNILVIPDILANAGGVVVSYFEWVQDLQNYCWPAPEVNRRLKEIMTKAFRNVYEQKKIHKTNMRLAAYILALEKVSKAKCLRGT